MHRFCFLNDRKVHPTLLVRDIRFADFLDHPSSIVMAFKWHQAHIIANLQRGRAPVRYFDDSTVHGLTHASVYMCSRDAYAGQPTSAATCSTLCFAAINASRAAPSRCSSSAVGCMCPFSRHDIRARSIPAFLASRMPEISSITLLARMLLMVGFWSITPARGAGTRLVGLTLFVISMQCLYTNK